MNALLRKLKDLKSDLCLTISLNTHRTAPDNLADPIALKQLIQQAESRLFEENYGEKKELQSLIERLKTLADTVDHQHNLEALVLFVNEDIAEYARLPIAVQNSVVIDQSFATRDLVRALHAQTGYYVLVLSQKEVRLIEAFNDKVVREFGKPFPIINDTLYSTLKADVANAPKQTNLTREFFNRVDKQLLESTADNPLPVLICAEESTLFEYHKVADKPERIIGQLIQSRLDLKAHHLVVDAWPIVSKYLQDRSAERLTELKTAIGAGKCLFDLNEIWSAIGQSRGQTLFVKSDFFQPAIIKDDKITPVDSEQHNQPDVIDDVLDEMMEEIFRFGGDVVFVEDDSLEEYGQVALITRY